MTEPATSSAGTRSTGAADVASAPPAEATTAATSDTGRQHAAPRRRRRALKSVRDMVFSLAAIAVPIAFIVVIYPHHAGDPVHVVSYSADLRQVSTLAPFPVEAPQGLSPMWRPTSDGYTPTPDDATWHIGFVTPLGAYAALEQTSGSAQPLLDADAAGVSPAGNVSINGVDWRRYTGGKHNALVRVMGPHDTVIVAGSAGLPELRDLAASLHIVTAPGAGATS